MKNLLKEPLVHFLVLGILIFVLFGATGDENKEREITIDTADIEHLVELWRLQWQRPPTEEELRNLVTNYINQEVMYREALAMNLDHNDEIVKRRLAQKMEFLSNDFSSLVNPTTEGNLVEYFENHKQEYLTEYQYSFSQIVFTSDNHNDPTAKAAEILADFGQDKGADLSVLGDQFPLNYSYDNVSASYLRKSIGDTFTDQLPSLETGKWTGPVTSGFGSHLVLITLKNEPQVPDFAHVRDKVLNDYEYAKAEESKSLFLKELKKDYTINITADNIDDDLKTSITDNLFQ